MSNWMMMSALQLLESHEGVSVGVTLTKVADQWHAVAFLSRGLQEAQGVDEKLSAFFAEHEHKFVGAFVDIYDAMAAAENYIDATFRAKRAIQPCACAEISDDAPDDGSRVLGYTGGGA